MKQYLLQRLFKGKQQKQPFTPERRQPSLAVCILMDLIGYASFAVPFLGEFIDLAWAPVSAAIYMRLFGGSRGVFGGIFNFIEELLPGFDFIPTFTISWFLSQYRKKQKSNTIYIPHTR